jgi:hypothetical protein
MPARLYRLVTVVAFAALTALATTSFAQFGHPLKGTWIGDWGPNKDTRTHVVVELNWDGKAITGRINPGPNSVAVKNATLDAPTWMVHLEGDGKDATGKAIHYVIDGKVENIGAYSRFITGTWTEGAAKGDFKITRS